MRLKFMTVFFCLKIVDLTILFCLFFPKVICDNNYAFKYIHYVFEMADLLSFISTSLALQFFITILNVVLF